MTGSLDVQDTFHRAVACFTAGDFTEAGRLLIAVLTVRSDCAAAWANLTTVLYNRAAQHANAGDLAAAVSLLRCVLSVDPAFPPARGTMPRLLVQLAGEASARGALTHAEELVRGAAVLDPDRSDLAPLRSDILFRRVLRLLEDADPSAALAALETALTTGRRDSQAVPAVTDRLSGLGRGLVSQKRFAEAIRCYDAALSLAPDDLDIHYYRMFAHLWVRDYRSAWNPEIWRDVYCKRSPRLWNGVDAVDNMLILHRNGVGDFIQFLMYIPEIIHLFGRIDIFVEKRLHPLTSSVFVRLFDDRVVAGKVRFVDEARVEAYDAYCEMLGLGMATGIPPTALTTKAPYLHADDALTTAWRSVVETLARGRTMRVGLIWSSGGPANIRSVGLHHLLPIIAGCPDILFCAMQNDEAKADLWALDIPTNLVDFGVRDFGSAAAAIRCMDLMITPDCGMAHLAAALGVETWLLVGDWCDWRWHIDGETSDWYPNVRIFRQHEAGNWSDPLGEIALLLDRRRGG